LQDWWNATSYTRYYRKWNVIVHDWLYEYIYRDVYALGWRPFSLGRRFLPTCAVFFVSALFHEYILSFAFRFIYPVLLVMFGGFGCEYNST
jgi:sterol O-acyltransferase